MCFFGLKIEAEVRIQSNDSLSLSSPFRTVIQLIFKSKSHLLFQTFIGPCNLDSFFVNYRHVIEQ